MILKVLYIFYKLSLTRYIAPLKFFNSKELNPCEVNINNSSKHHSSQANNSYPFIFLFYVSITTPDPSKPLEGNSVGAAAP